MSATTKRASIVAVMAMMLGAALVLGITYVTQPQAAGANPLPGDEAPTLESLNEGKKNEDDVQLRTGQVNKDTTGGVNPHSGRTSVVFASDAQPQEAFPGCVDEVTVSITPVRNNTDPNNAPVDAQVSENSRTGFNVRLLNDQVDGISGQNVRFTFIAYGVDRDSDCDGTPDPTPTPTPTPKPDDQDCDDFSTQGEAQAHLDADATDPDKLDEDEDGIACEELPAELPPVGADVVFLNVFGPNCPSMELVGPTSFELPDGITRIDQPGTDNDVPAGEYAGVVAAADPANTCVVFFLDADQEVVGSVSVFAPVDATANISVVVPDVGQAA